MATQEDEDIARERVSDAIEDDEHVRVDVQRYAHLEWDERPKPGRPEPTGQWVLHFSDGSSEEIDLPRESVALTVEEAKARVARRLTGR